MVSQSQLSETQILNWVPQKKKKKKVDKLHAESLNGKQVKLNVFFYKKHFNQ